MTRKERGAEAVRLLKEKYPDAKCSLEYKHPHELLIATRLSAQCTDKRVNIVTKTLFERFRSIDDFADADISEIEEIIKPCGLYKTKAKSIKEMCIQLREEYNYTLPDTIEELTKLSGVGRKTANLIVGDIYNKPAIVTDTHCIRICGRLGLTKNTEPKKVEDDLRKVIEPSEGNNFCHRLVLFGRDTCKARGEKCEICELSGICKHFNSTKNR
ncbi:MAG: endonuclease III [Ruminococcus sp.]|nr:endonuclease III [Ruminococcus sp.]